MEQEKTTEKLLELYKNRRFADLRMLLLDMESADIAAFAEEELDEKERLFFFRLLPKELASDVFVEFDSDTQEELIKAFTDKELKAVIDDMFLDDTVDIIDEMPANVVKRILLAADPDERKTINELLEYPDDSAGSLMTPEFVSLSANMTVSDAFDKIRRTGVNKETISTCYVTDIRNPLIGVVTVKDLLLADKETLIEDTEHGVFLTQKLAHAAYDSRAVTLSPAWETRYRICVTDTGEVLRLPEGVPEPDNTEDTYAVWGLPEEHP